MMGVTKKRLVATALFIFIAGLAPMGVTVAAETKSGGGSKKDSQPKDFNGAAAGVFSNARVTSLFPAGAILGSAFALPPLPGDSAKAGTSKRLYLVLAVASLSSCLLATVFSSAAINRLSLAPPAPAASLAALLERDFALLWYGTVFHFYAGLLGLVALVGLRAWATFACPKFGRVAAVVLGSALLLMGSVIADEPSLCGEGSPLSVGLRYAHALKERFFAGNVLTILAIDGAALAVYLTAKGAHDVYTHMKSKQE